MPLYRKEIIENKAILGLWEITENIDFFYRDVVFNESDSILYNSFHTDSRRLQWLSVRVLMKRLLSIQGRINIEYDSNARPYFPDKSYKVSISHSHDMSAVLLSPTHATGIDIELIEPRIIRIAHKFMSPSELEFVCESNRIETLHVCWGIKEALYKFFADPTMSLYRDIRIKPFAYEGKGVAQAIVSHKNNVSEYTLHYDTIKNYILVYIV